MGENVLEYHEFVQKKLKYLERYTSLIKDGNIPPDAINHALASYQGVGNWIVSEYEMVCLEFDNMKEEYQVDWDDWFLAARKKLNETKLTSKFASVSEVEATARVENRDAYLRWQSKLKIMERKVSLYRRLMENWKNQKDMIVQLSANSRSEMKALGIQDLANYDETKKVKKQKLLD